MKVREINSLVISSVKIEPFVLVLSHLGPQRGSSFMRDYLMWSSADILEGFDAVERENPALSAQLDALADLKFTYVVSCQMYGLQKSSGDPHAQDVLDLMIR